MEAPRMYEDEMLNLISEYKAAVVNLKNYCDENGYDFNTALVIGSNLIS